MRTFIRIATAFLALYISDTTALTILHGDDLRESDHNAQDNGPNNSRKNLGEDARNTEVRRNAMYLLDAAAPQSIKERVRRMDQHRRSNVGGYFPADLRDPSVVQAASFAFEALSQSPPDDYSFGSSLDDSSHMEVLEASQQVVAGKNFKLTIAVSDENQECVGAFAVYVWDHFGEMSVTRWAHELSCDEADALRHQDEFENEDSEEGGPDN